MRTGAVLGGVARAAGRGSRGGTHENSRAAQRAAIALARRATSAVAASATGGASKGLQLALRLVPFLLALALAEAAFATLVLFGVVATLSRSTAGATTCAVIGASAASAQNSDPPPADLIPIYRAAAQRYGLGPDGWTYLAAINRIETDYGRNLSVSSAGALGWMQFEPGTWARYGVDGNGDGSIDPYDKYDAIYSAANYLHASGAPANWNVAIFAYNHASWYVADVISHARADIGQCTTTSTLTLVPGQYTNPFRGARHVLASRIDMGVDYSDVSPEPIDAIGSGIVTLSGWEGGGFGEAVNITLTDGPYAGRYVYVAEGIVPTVTSGQRVQAGQQIAIFLAGSAIEIGFAAGPGLFGTLAAKYGQESTVGDPGDTRTYCGQMMSDLIQQLGGPPGITTDTQGNAKTVHGTGCPP